MYEKPEFNGGFIFFDGLRSSDLALRFARYIAGVGSKASVSVHELTWSNCGPANAHKFAVIDARGIKPDVINRFIHPAA
jgi:hypothetical protein